MTLKKVTAKIKIVKMKILNIKSMRPGNITQQYNVCGSPGCACRDEKNPKKHGPYFKLNYQFQGKSRTVFIREKLVKEIKMENQNYKTFKELTKIWITLEIERSNLIMKMKNTNLDG